MDKFIGNITDTLESKNPFGSWRRAKNILLHKGFGSVSNEDGNAELYSITGVVVGSIITNTDEVYFSVDGSTSEIGYINKRVETPTYEIILRDSNLGFRLDTPIEGIYFYNYKDELITMWCFGNKDVSTRPMILNITNPVFSITSGTIDNSNDLELIYLFPRLNEGDLISTRLSKGNFTGDIVYITYAYI